MRVAFLGTAEFAVPTLRGLLESDHEVVGVVTGPDKPAGRGRRLRPTPVKRVAEAAGLPLLTPSRLKDPAFLADFTSRRPDVAVVVAFRILPRELFTLPPHGTLNVHPSLLPRYRGPAPVNWALINGERETGVSIIRISETVDAGGLLLQEKVAVDPLETAGELAARLASLGAMMTLRALEGLAEGSLVPLPQDDSLVTRAPKLVKEDGRIDWSRSALEVHNRVRGVDPWPGAYGTLSGRMLKLFRSRPLEHPSGQPGEILEAGGELVVACGAGAVAFAEVQLAGKKRMQVSDFLRGFRLAVGARFESVVEGGDG